MICESARPPGGHFHKSFRSAISLVLRDDLVIERDENGDDGEEQ